MINQIMVCLDGSPLAERILPLAKAIASAECATLTLLRVVKVPQKCLGKKTTYASPPALRRARQACRLRRSSISYPRRTGERADDSRGNNNARSNRVVGRVLGSVAFQVIRGAKRPVILYPPLDTRKKIDTIVVAVDGSDFSETIIPYAAEIAKAFSARRLLV
jgi:nucleotide-binding universal stress UspA family protein